MSASTVSDLQGSLAVQHGCTKEPKHRCMDPTHPESKRPSYTSKKELKRHEKVHDPKSKRYYCGCCRNLGVEYKDHTRKDKVRDHMRGKHGEPKSEDNLAIECPGEGCSVLLTADSCIDEHMRQAHPGDQWEMPSQTTNSEYIIP